MKTVVLDSYALLVYFEQEPGWDEVAQVLVEAAAETCRLCLSVINWGEVYYITWRVYGEEAAEQVLRTVDELPIELVEAGRTQAAHAARLKVGGGLSYADCFAAGLAMQKGGEVMTGDPEFGQVETQVPIRWLPHRKPPL